MMSNRKAKWTGVLMMLGAVGLVAAGADQIPTPRDAAGAPLVLRTEGVTVGTQQVINREDVGRQEVEHRAAELVREANAFFGDGEYIAARDKYLEAVKLFRSYNTAEFQSKVEHCRRQIGLCYYYMAQEAMARADRQAGAQDFEEAIQECREAQKYYPEGAEELQRKIEIYERRRAAAQTRLDVSAEKLLPNQKSQEYQVEVLLQQGRELGTAREYGKALRKFQEALLIDPYNSDALQGMKAMNLRIGKVGRERYVVTHREMVAEAEWEFAIPIVPEGETESGSNFIESGAQEKAGVDAGPLLKKLNSIRLPKIDYDEVSIPAAVKSLVKEIRKHDPEGFGVNIFLRRSDHSANREQAREDGGFGDGLAGDIQPQGIPNAGAEADGGDGSEAADEKTVKVNLHISEGETAMKVIKELCADPAHNLKYRVEPYAVIIAPKDVALDEMEAQIFPVEQQSLEASLDGDITDSGSLIRYFENRGIEFPEGSKAVFDPMISRLIVTNTPENLNKIEQLLTDEFETQEPLIQVTAKFIEISQTDLKELAFNYQYAVNTANTDSNTSATKIDSSSNELMRYYRDVDDSKGTDPLGESTFSYVWENTDGTRFSASLFALNWADSVDVLASPRVTTLSGQTAHVEMVLERYFPEEWEVVDMPENNSGGSGDNASATTSSWRGTRADPQAVFESEPTKLGIQFDITPERVGERRIQAPINFPYQQLSGWMEFDARTTDSSGSVEGEYYKMPIFDRRTIVTNVTADDGETVVIGGVAADKTEVVNDKIPILGDLPLIGRFFQSKYTNAEKRNLLVFITFRLVKPDGSAFFPNGVSADDDETGAMRSRRGNGVPDFGRNR